MGLMGPERRPPSHISPMSPIGPIRGMSLWWCSTPALPNRPQCPIEDEDDDEYEDEKIHFSPLTNRFSRLTSLLVSQLKSDDRRKGTATWGRRQLRNLLTRLSHGIIDDRVARAIHDFEFRHRSIRLDLEAHIDYKGGTGGDFAVRLVPGALKPILDDLSVKTDVGFAIAGCRPVLMSLAVPGSLLILIGLRATASFPVLFLCVRTVFRFLGSFT
jgi:hypothetical protein